MTIGGWFWRISTQGQPEERRRHQPIDAHRRIRDPALYRQRWQVELALKHLKSIPQLDRLPAKAPVAAGCSREKPSRVVAWLPGSALHAAPE
jgi:hypothetical protein